MKSAELSWLTMFIFIKGYQMRWRINDIGGARKTERSPAREGITGQGDVSEEINGLLWCRF